MTSNNIKTGFCSVCGTFNSASLRCNCAHKTLTDSQTPTKNLDTYSSYRATAFDATGQFLSDKEIDALLAVAEKEPKVQTDALTPKYYGAKCKCGAKLDPYIICDAYATSPNKGSAWHHAVKKLLRAGDGHKPLHQDIQEVIDTLKRWQEQINA